MDEHHRPQIPEHREETMDRKRPSMTAKRCILILFIMGSVCGLLMLWWGHSPTEGAITSTDSQSAYRVRGDSLPPLPGPVIHEPQWNDPGFEQRPNRVSSQSLTSQTMTSHVGVAFVNGSDYRSNGSDDASLLFRVPTKYIRERSVNGSILDYLPDYKNPCWRERDHKSSRLRCLPYLYLIGATKSGTTDLYKTLITHPDIAAPAHKETFFWNWNRLGLEKPGTPEAKLDGYISVYDRAAVQIERHVIKGNDGRPYHPQITVDATPNYIWHFGAWKNVPGNKGLATPRYTLAHTLNRVNPETRIMAILRHPTDRLYSLYHHWNRKTYSPDEFDGLVRQALAKMEACLGAGTSLKECVYSGASHVGKQMVLHSSLYALLLEDYFNVFPREQIMIIKGADYYADPLKVLSNISQFLGIGQVNTAIEDRVDMRNSFSSIYGGKRYEAMRPETKTLLDDFYRPFNKDLAKLLGDDRFLYVRKNKTMLTKL